MMNKLKTYKTFFYGFLLISIFSSPSFAQSNQIKAKWGELGLVAGVGYACKSNKLKDYEIIVSALMEAENPQNSNFNKALESYSFSKMESYKKQKIFSIMTCSEANRLFDNQDIFKTKIYNNGIIKTPDGKSYKLSQDSTQKLKKYVIAENERKAENKTNYAAPTQKVIEPQTQAVQENPKTTMPQKRRSSVKRLKAK